MEEAIEIWEFRKRLHAFVHRYRVHDDGKPAYCEFCFGVIGGRPTEVDLRITSRFDTSGGSQPRQPSRAGSRTITDTR